MRLRKDRRPRESQPTQDQQSGASCVVENRRRAGFKGPRRGLIRRNHQAIPQTDGLPLPSSSPLGSLHSYSHPGSDSSGRTHVEPPHATHVPFCPRVSVFCLRLFRAFVYPRLVTLDLWTWVEAICGWAKMVWQSADPGLGPPAGLDYSDSVCTYAPVVTRSVSAHTCSRSANARVALPSWACCGSSHSPALLLT